MIIFRSEFRDARDASEIARSILEHAATHPQELKRNLESAGSNATHWSRIEQG